MKNSPQPSIIDVEASGLGKNSYPIEVGLVLADDRRYCSLIKPKPQWNHWDESAEALHQISRATLEKHGKPVEEVAQDLNQLLQGSVIYSDGWVVDEPWIIRLFEEAKMSRRFVFYDLQTILTEAQMEIWHEIKHQVIDDLDISRHRASNDARIVQETYTRTFTLTKKV